MGMVARPVIVLALLCACVPAGAAAHQPGGWGRLTSVGTGQDAVPVLFAGGTPYDIGYWHGKLCRPAVVTQVSRVLAAMARGGCGPDRLASIWQQAAPHVSAEAKQELQGLADGSGVPIERLRHLQLVPDAVTCSGFAAWGRATTNGHLLQARVLDYGLELGPQDRPLIIIAEPKGALRYVNVGFAGVIGAVTGFNGAGLGVANIGIRHGGSSLRPGEPMMLLFRDLLAKGRTLEQAERLLEQAPRTGAWWYLLADAKLPGAKLYRTGPKRVVGMPDEPAGFPKQPQVVYYGFFNERLSQALDAKWGKLDADTAMQISRQVAMRHANMMNAVYDLTTQELWVSYARGTTPACERAAVRLKLADYQSKPERPATT